MTSSKHECHFRPKNLRTLWFPNNMKRFLIQTVLIIVVQSQILRAQASNSIGLDSGERLAISPDWTGQEQVITRLCKNGVNYSFVRNSKDTYVIKTEGTAGEVFFKFHTALPGNSPGLDNAKMIDIYRDGDRITALTFGSRGFYLVSASRKLPDLEKGEFYFQPKLIRVENWNLALSVSVIDYYENIDAGSAVSPKASTVKLVGLDKVEITRYLQNGETSKPDMFSFVGDHLLKNGEDTGRMILVVHPIVDEVKIAEAITKMESDENLRMMILSIAENKDEFYSLISNYKNKDNFDVIKRRVDKAFQMNPSK